MYLSLYPNLPYPSQDSIKTQKANWANYISLKPEHFLMFIHVLFILYFNNLRIFFLEKKVATIILSHIELIVHALFTCKRHLLI